jgi:microcystin degradation protein MlrC
LNDQTTHGKGYARMTITIAFAGFLHETNTFAETPTGLDEFIANGYFHGDEILTFAGSNTVAGGVIDRVASMPDATLIPLATTSAIPGGLVTAETVETVEDEILERLRQITANAVILDLHGAMMTQLSDDGEASLLRRVRDVVGPSVPVIAVLDLHCHFSEEMVDLADILLPYNTYPHVDLAERGIEAVDLAVDMVNGNLKPVSVLAKPAVLPPLPHQFSGVEPTHSIMERVFACESRPEVVNVGIGFGFPYADNPLAGMGVIVTTNYDRQLARQVADEVADFIFARREEFRPNVLTVEEAVHAAMEEDHGPVVLADLGDNPGGGSACDGTALLWALLDLGASGAAFGVIADREAVEAAFDAGVGAQLDIMLGGKTDDLHGFPIPVQATVQSLSDGRFVYEGPVETGREDTMGKTAVLACAGRHENVVQVIVCERRMQPLDTAIFRSQGIEPTEQKIVVVKSSVHYRGAFGPIAARIIEVDTPGLTGVNLSRFLYHRLNRPIWPIDAI